MPPSSPSLTTSPSSSSLRERLLSSVRVGDARIVMRIDITVKGRSL